MARYDCERCGVTCHTTEGPHLCKDIAARLRRRERQVEAVKGVLRNRRMDRDIEPDILTEAAEHIVMELARMGVAED